MGIGDDIIATGLARGAKARGKRIAFGDGKTIKWGPYSKMIFKNNPNIALPGSEHGTDIEWVNFYKGHRVYNNAGNNRWIWNYQFKVKPGEIFLDEDEEFIPYDKLVLIEPNVPHKPCGPNKQWPVERFKTVAEDLTSKGYTVRQFSYGGFNVVAEGIETKTFRKAVGLLKRAKLAILPEGGLHHAAAAVGCPAVVLFGGFVPPAVLGYESHTNLTGGAKACGSFSKCPHCISAMNRIDEETVLSAAMGKLQCR